MKLNETYTYDYSQPKEYRFSLDSVFLSQVVAKHVKNKFDESMKVLDLCSGCGVVGLELQFHCSEIKNIDFLEVQSVYIDHFNHNKSQVKGDNLNLNLILNNYEILLNPEYESHYDLIVSNPPYFFKNEGLLSPNEFKNRCRFFLDSDFKNLILGIYNSLKTNAEAFILLRPGTHHGRDLLKETRKLLETKALVEIFNEVRGTNVVRIIKL